MDDLRESIECLCNSPQRFRILGILTGTQMDVRDLMSALDCSRSTVQRNLMVLKERGWVEETCSGYLTTTIGELLYEEFGRVNETTTAIKRMAPFFEVVDTPPEIEISLLTDALVTTPDPAQPNAPTKRLFEAFDGGDSVRGFVPVVSCFVVELFRNTDRTIVEHEYIITPDVFDTLYEQYPDEWMGASGRDHSLCLKIQLYDGDIPYGLFISGGRLALVAYNEVGRMQALVESTTEGAVEWGEQMYETYRCQSTEPERDVPHVTHDAELVN